jgi:hypothetical protein
MPALLHVDGGVPAGAYLPDLEDYVASYGGAGLVDDLRAALRRMRSAAPGEAPSPSPEALRQQQSARGVNHAIILPEEAFVGLEVGDERRRRTLQRAVIHYHADRWRPHRAWATVAAGLTLMTIGEALAQLDFAVKRLGLEVVAISGDARDLPAARLGPFWARLTELQVPVLGAAAALGRAA